jgi:hypothetical protein
MVSNMRRSDVFQSKYLKAEDLGGKPAVVTIKAATFEVLKSPEGKEQGKTVLCFTKGGKLLPLNMVNWDSTADICGDDTDSWPGHRIELYPTTTTMGGRIVDCIRIRRPNGQLSPAPKAAAEPATPATDDLDEIPW